MAFGIDFGTTNSATVELIGSRPKNHSDKAGLPFPSRLAIDKLTGEVVARGAAVNGLGKTRLAQCEVITSPKMLLGSDYCKKIGPYMWRPQDFVREIFIGLKEVVSRSGGRLEEAVVATPVGFSAASKAALRESVQEAGIEIASFISEPTAALFQNLDRIDNLRRILVFDWGGGTLDLALLAFDEKDHVSEQDSLGLRKGGDDLDLKLASHIYQKFQKQAGVAIPLKDIDSQAERDLLGACEKAKRDLSTADTASVNVPAVVAGNDLMIDISADELEALYATEYDEALNAIQDLLKRNHLDYSDLGAIIMVGGSSKLTGLADRINNLAASCLVLPPDENAD